MSRQTTTSGKITNPLAAAQPNLFYQLLPEVFRLMTLRNKIASSGAVRIVLHLCLPKYQKMALDWNRDKETITGEYYMAMNTCNIKLSELLTNHFEKIKELLPLIEYIIERMDAVMVLTQNELLWDADIIVRSALETLVKFAFIADAEESERPQLIQEFWYDLSEIYTIKLSDQAKKNLSNTTGNEIHRLAHTPQVVTAEEESRLRAKWSKADRTRLEQKWSFTGIVAALAKKNSGAYAASIELVTHTYRMSSHIAHGDEMGINLIRERKSRSPQDQQDVTIAHYLRLVSDVFGYCILTAFYTCKYLKTDPTFFAELYNTVKKYDADVQAYHMAPFKDKIYDKYKKGEPEE